MSEHDEMDDAVEAEADAAEPNAANPDPRDSRHHDHADASPGIGGKNAADVAFGLVLLVCVLLLAAEAFVHKHTHFGFEEFPAFYAIVGFVSYVGLVFTAKGLRKLLMRDENYYGEAEPSAAKSKGGER